MGCSANRRRRLFWGKDSVYIFHMTRCVCTPYCGLAVCVFSSCSSIKARWPSVCVWTYLVVREETECLCCFFSCVRTPWSAPVHIVVVTGTGFGKINSESLQIHYTCSCLGRHLPVQHSGIDLNCGNQVIENSKLPFFGSRLSENSPCIADKQVMVVVAAAVAACIGNVRDV